MQTQWFQTFSAISGIIHKTKRFVFMQAEHKKDPFSNYSKTDPHLLIDHLI